MPDPLRVLILEDEPRDAKLMVHELSRAGFTPQWERVDTEGDYRARLGPEFDIILADGFVPGFDAMRAIEILKERRLEIPIIVITGSLEDERAVEFMKCGAVDYLLKDRLARLGQAVSQALEKRRLAEEKQRIEEERNQFFALSVDMMCIAGFDGRFIFLNPAWEAALGWSVNELLSRPHIEFVHPDDHELTKAEVGRLTTRAERTLAFENRYQCKDGTYKWLSWRVTSDPTRSLIYATARDTTQQRLAEAELRTTNQTLQSLIEAAPLAIALLDPAGTVRLWNRAAERMFGWSAAEVVGSAKPNVPVDRQREYLEVFRRLLSGEAITGLETQLLTRDGKLRDVILSVAPVTSANGELSGVIEILNDVTEQKILEEQFRQAQKMDVVGRLAGGVAHDFNNLLTVINGYSDLLLQELSPEDDHARDLLMEIHKAGVRSAGLTRQLLTFSRRQVIAPQILDLRSVVADTEKMLRRLIGEDIDLRVVSDSGLWTVKADPGQMEQVILNLAVNARDAMPQGGTLVIETRNIGESDGDGLTDRHVLLSVTDSGVGMDGATKARIFEPFFSTKGDKGTGLGLATVQGIVRQCDGRIEVESEAGHGTAFRLYFPAVNGNVSSGKSFPGQAVTPKGTETILLVEDEDAVRAFTRLILKGCGYTMLEARTGHDAIGIASRHGAPIHLLVTDVVLPEMGGRELADRFVALYPGARTLFLSGYTNDAVLRYGVEHAETAFIQKPFTPAALAQKVREILNSGG